MKISMSNQRKSKAKTKNPKAPNRQTLLKKYQAMKKKNKSTTGMPNLQAQLAKNVLFKG